MMLIRRRGSIEQTIAFLVGLLLLRKRAEVIWNCETYLNRRVNHEVDEVILRFIGNRGGG